MMRWRLVVVAGVMAGGLSVAGPVSALDEETPPGSDLAGFDQGSTSDDTWTTIGWGALTGLSNLLYVPAKVVYASMGAITGGLALGLTGGDLNTAEAIWEPSLKGDYFLTPGMVQGEEPISFAGAPAGLTSEVPGDPPATVAPPDRQRDS